MPNLLKLDLQMFADGDEPGTDTTIETTDNQLSASEQFDKLYYGDDDVQDDLDDDTVNDDSGEVLGGDTDPADDDTEQQEPPQNQPWKNEQNAQFAAERRRQEEAQRQQAAVDAAYARIYAGQVNPYTGKPIQSEADYNAYIQQHTMEQLKQANVDPNMFQNAVKADPTVRQAQAIVQQQQEFQRQQQAQKQAQELNDSIKAISASFPEVKNAQDIISNPHFNEIEAMWKAGYKLEHAFFIANQQEMAQKRQAAAKQQVINQVTGKQHMKKTGNSGAGNEVVVPADVMAIYRDMFPDKSDAEIKAHYARMNKK